MMTTSGKGRNYKEERLGPRVERRPSVVAVVLNWNNYEDTAMCLEDLSSLSYPHLDVLVVDNGSTDGSIDKLEQEFSSPEVLRNGENLGFAGGMNVGISTALDKDADYIWLLNNDILFPDVTVLDTLVSTMEDRPECGILSPEIREYPDTDVIWFKGAEIDWSTGYTYHVIDEEIHRRMLETSYVPFCCALARADIFDNVGLLPEVYYLYYEDVDFAIRVKESGYMLQVTTDCRIFHKESASSGGRMNATFSYYRTRNMFLFQDRYREKVEGYTRITTLFQVLIALGIRILHRNVQGIRGVLHGAIHGLLRKTGRGPYP